MSGACPRRESDDCSMSGTPTDDQRTVLSELVTILSDATFAEVYQWRAVLAILCIDPTTPIDVLRSRLRIGERAEQCVLADFGVVTVPNSEFTREDTAADFLVWLRAVDTKETP
jgi:hypothetical protein